MGQCFAKGDKKSAPAEKEANKKVHQKEARSSKPRAADQAKQSTKKEKPSGVAVEGQLHEDTATLYQKHETIIKKHADERARCFDGMCVYCGVCVCVCVLRLTPISALPLSAPVCGGPTVKRLLFVV
jgi:ferredoxin